MSLEVEVSLLSGDTQSLQASDAETIGGIKRKLQELTGIPVHEQRILGACGMVLGNSELLGAASTGNAAFLTLIRRDPEQARWLEKVEANWLALKDAPVDIRACEEAILSAMQQNDIAFWFAPAQLCSKPSFIVSVKKRKGWPDLSDNSDISREFCTTGSPQQSQWIRTSTDAKLALYVAGHCSIPGLVAAVLDAPAVVKADELVRVALVAPLAWAMSQLEGVAHPVRGELVPDSLGKLVRGFPRDVLHKAFSEPVLVNLQMGVELLELVSGAPERGVLGRLGRGVGSAVGGMFRRGPPLEEIVAEAVEPTIAMPMFAITLSTRHAHLFQARKRIDLWDRLLPHLRESHHQIISNHGQLDGEACSALVRCCIVHDQVADAEQFFQSADDSNDFVAMLADSEIPLTLSLLHGHRFRASLLSKVLQAWGGAEEVLAAIGRDRKQLRTLLRIAEGDEQIGRCSEFRAVLRLAVDSGETMAGRALLRAYAAPEPQELPTFCTVPLEWLSELRMVPGCSRLAIEALLEAIETLTDDCEAGRVASQLWRDMEWRLATPAQLDRSSGVLCRWLHAGSHLAAEVGGREGEQRRQNLNEQWCNALTALPLDALLKTVEGLHDDDHVAAVAPQFWGDVNWQDAESSGLDRAIDVLCRWGRAGALSAAEPGGRESEVQRQDLNRRLCNALAALPLLRLRDSRKLLAPELPEKATSILIIQRVGQLEDTIGTMQTEITTMQGHLNRANSRIQSLEDDLSRTRSKIGRLESEIAARRTATAS